MIFPKKSIHHFSLVYRVFILVKSIGNIPFAWTALDWHPCGGISGFFTVSFTLKDD
jgi:hypothetical protein